MSHARVRDRNPEIRAAGKVLEPGPGAREAFLPPSPPSRSTPEAVRRFRKSTEPQPGEARVIHTSVNEPSAAKGMVHGITSKDSFAAAELVNPPCKSRFEQAELDQQESIYNSRKTKPLGSCHDQLVGLPQGVDPETALFGRPTAKSDPASLLVSPPKSTKEVEEEAEIGSELYKTSHNSYEVGEMVDRNYDWSKFTKGSLYGVPTPHDNSGVEVRKAMHWLTNQKGATLSSKRVEDFREKTQPQVGRVHDPNADTRDIPEDYTFGVMVKPDELAAGDLMRTDGPSTYLSARVFDKGVLSSIRNRLRASKYHSLQELLTALQHCDETGEGWIEAQDVRDTFFKQMVPITPEMTEMLIRWCASDDASGHVLYLELLALLDWKKELSDYLCNRLIARGEAVDGSGQQDLAPILKSNYCKSSQLISAMVGVSPSLEKDRSFGVPTVRYDKPAPRIRRVGDNTNYGDESDAYGTMYPSLFSNKGVYEEDMFAPRTCKQIREIFRSIGVELNDEAFDRLWKEAAGRDPNGEVSVELFRGVLEETQAKHVLDMCENI